MSDKQTGVSSGFFGIVLVLALLLALMPSNAQNAASPADSDDVGEPAIIAVNLDINALDPHRAFCDSCRTYLASAYETLLALDADNKPVGLLAASWSANAAQTEFTFQLAPAAKFADGTPVEAHDVKWSLERLKNLRAAPAFLMADVATVDTPDERTVVIRLSRPNSEFPLFLAAPYAAIVNSDLATANGARADADASRFDKSEAWFVRNSAGSGPFTLQSYRTGEELSLARNPAYWRQPAHLPEVSLVHAVDAAAQADLLANGDADIAIGIDPHGARKLAKNRNIVLLREPSDHFIYLALSPGAKSGGQLLTPVLREAIDLALDRDALIHATLPGAAELQSPPISALAPGGGGYVARVHDLARARALVAAAGFSAGVTLDAAFPALVAYGVDFTILMQAVQHQLAQAGIKLNLKPMSFADWRETINGDGIPLTAVFYAPDYLGTAQYVEYFGMVEGSPWARRAGLKGPGGFNAREAQLMKQALSEPLDQAAITWHRIGLEMISDRIVLPIMSPDIVLAHHRNIAGLRYTTCCGVPLAELRRE